MSYLGNPLSTVDFPVDYFTGDGTSTTFQLSRIPASATSILVHIGGVKQVASTTDPAYYLDGSKLVFVSPPGAYSPIEVNYLGIAGQVNIPGVQSVTQDMLSLQLANTFVYQTTANGATASFTLNAPPVSANSLVVSANGVVQYDYSVNGNNLTFGFTPPVGTFIRVTSLALAQAGVPADGSVTSVKLGANLTITGNTTFDGFAGAGARILGDFSNATVANRLAFQTSTTNSSTNLVAIPNGTGTGSSFSLFTNASDPANSSLGQLRASSLTGDVGLIANITGTGTYLPLTMWTGGSERLRIDTSGNVGIGTSSPSRKLQVFEPTAQVVALFQSNNATSSQVRVLDAGGSETGGIQLYTNATTCSLVAGDNVTLKPLTFVTNSTERVRITSAGNVGIGTGTPTQKLHVSNGALFAQGSSDWFGIRGNSQNIPPSDDGTNALLAINSNYSSGGGEVNFWNTNQSLAGGFRFMQKTGASTFNDVMYLQGNNGNVGIGTITPVNRLDITAVKANQDLDSIGQMVIRDTTVFSGSPVAGIQFSVKYNTAGSYAYGTSIQGFKENATDGNFAQALRFTTQGNGDSPRERMRITSAGRVGIGLNAPVSVFEVATGGTGTTPNAVSQFTSYIHNSTVGVNAGELAGWGVRYGSVASTPIWFGARFLKNGVNAASDFAVYTAPDGDITSLVERLTVGANGNVGIGTSSPAMSLHVVKNWTSGKSTVGAQTVTSFASGGIAGFGCFDSDGSRALYLYSNADEAAVINGKNTRLTFWTNETERMRIFSGGQLSVNTTSNTTTGATHQVNVVGASGARGIGVVTPTFDLQCLSLHNQATSNDNRWVYFYSESSATDRGSIDYNRGAGQVRYNTTSDATLKNIMGDSDGQKSVDILKSTRIREFAWKDDAEQKPQVGVIAQELYETYKGAVSVGGDDAEGNYRPWGVDKTAFTFHLIAGWQAHEKLIQEQQAQIEELKAEIQLLKAK